MGLKEKRKLKGSLKIVRIFSANLPKQFGRFKKTFREIRQKF